MAGLLNKHINLNKLSAGSYTAGWHMDWNVGPVLQGGYVAAMMHRAASDHLTTELANTDQPDILRLHYEFLHPCELRDSFITVEPIKVGAGSSTLQISLFQKDKLRVLAFAITINFAKPWGPSAAMQFTLRPPPNPVPEFDLALANKPQPHWISTTTEGEVFPCLKRLLTLAPRQGYPTDGILDTWSHWNEDEPMDISYLIILTDCFPSMSDTLLQNKGIYDAHKNHKTLVEWDKENPGVPATLTNTVAEALKAPTFNSSLTLDIEFKKRVPKEGLPWVFTRLTSKELKEGRMDLDISLCDEKMDLLLTATQTMLVLDSFRRFGGGKGKGKRKGKPNASL